MSTRLGDLVERLGGRLIGNADLIVVGIAPLSDADSSHITFLSNPKLRTQAAQTKAACLILSEKDHEAMTDFAGARIVAANPYAYFAHAAQFFAALNAPQRSAGIHSSAVVHATARIARSAVIGPHVVIAENAVVDDDCVIEAGCVLGRSVHIGKGTLFHPRVTFLDGCSIGQRGIIHSGAVIGADGFGFANESGKWIKIPQTGAVRIGDDVEIGANTTIDRGALADTVIEEGVKLDNQIQIGHNCHIGAHTAMAGCVGVAGSAMIGKYCTFGGAAMILGHLTIADKVHISSGSLVSRSISEPGQYTGIYPLAKNADWEKSAVIVRNLSSMREKIRELEKTIQSLGEQTK